MSLGPTEQVALAALRKVRRESKARKRIGLAPGLMQFLKARQDLIASIAAAEQAAHKCSMNVTAHALNRAKNAAGWEIDGNIEEAGRASRDER
jgi:hypothetical protein